MATTNQYVETYLRFNGRMDREEFAFSVIKMCILAPVIAYVTAIFVFIISGKFNFGDWMNIIKLIAYWPAFALICKRYHDLGISGWSVIPFVVLPSLIIKLKPVRTEGMETVFFFFVSMFLLISLVRLFGKEGDRSDNQYN